MTVVGLYSNWVIDIVSDLARHNKSSTFFLNKVEKLVFLSADHNYSFSGNQS